MYGSYGMYSGNRANFSSASNLYRPAGVINIQVSNTPQTGNVNGTNIGLINGKGTDGTIVGLSSAPHTSIMSTLTQYGTASSALTTNTSYNAQHVDYGQNPPAVINPTGTQNISQLIPYIPTTYTINIIQAGGPIGGNKGHYTYSYTPGMVLPIVGSYVTVTGVKELDGVTPYALFNGTFSVFSASSSPAVIVLICNGIILPLGSAPNTGVITFTQ